MAYLYLPNFSLEKCREIKFQRHLYCQASGCSKSNDGWFWDELLTLASGFGQSVQLDEKFYVATDSQSNWHKMQGEHAVGIVYSQYIGEVQYKHTTHVYSWMKVLSHGLVIGQHGHNEHFEVDGNEYVRRAKEIYLFCKSGEMEVCEKNETHCLVNDTNGVLDVVSCKIFPYMRIRSSNR